MLLKIIVGVLLLIILYCLGSAVVYLVRDDVSSVQMAKALTWRVSVSLLVFIILIVSFSMGWIQPHAVFPVAGR